MVNRILVPVDFTEVSRLKSQMADEVAQQTGAKLYFMHAVAMVDQLYFSGGYYTWSYDQTSTNHEAHIEEASHRLNEFVKSFEIKSPYECRVRTGVPYLQILEVQVELEARMIIMSAHDHTVLGRLFLGGNTSYVLHHAKCPVYIYKDHEEEMSNNFVVPIGFTDIDKLIAHQADEWAQKTGATLHFIHAAPLVNPVMGHEKEPAFSYNLTADEAVDKLHRRLQGFIDFCSIKSPFECHLKLGKSYLEILNLQEELKAKLIIISAHDHTMIGRLLRGSTSDYVLNHAKCPIYVHKAID